MGKKKNSVKEESILDIFAYIYRRILLPSCLLHTVITFAVMLISDHNAVTSDKAGLIFLFSIAISLSNLWFCAKQMHILLRATLHFVCMTTSFTAIMLYGSGNFKNNSSGTLMILVVYVVLYLLIAPFPVYLMHKKEKKNEEATEYQSIYQR